MRKAVIAGIGSTAFGRHQDRSIQSLAVEAGRAALAESGVDRARIGALYLGNFTAGPLCGQEVLAGITVDELGLGPIPATKVEGACASGGIAGATWRWSPMNACQCWRSFSTGWSG